LKLWTCRARRTALRGGRWFRSAAAGIPRTSPSAMARTAELVSPTRPSHATCLRLLPNRRDECRLLLFLRGRRSCKAPRQQIPTPVSWEPLRPQEVHLPLPNPIHRLVLSWNCMSKCNIRLIYSGDSLRNLTVLGWLMRLTRLSGTSAAILLALFFLSSEPGAAQGSTPPKVRAIRFVALTAGRDHTCGLTSKGAAYCWGRNDSGQLGIGMADESPHPIRLRVSGPLRFRSIAANGNHTCGLTATGVAYCWGENKFGQLGNGTLIRAESPVQVTGNLRFRSLSTGATHTCGTAISGISYCWGGNWHGQLGSGALSGEERYPCCQTSPGSVVSDRRFSFVLAGGIHTCGLAVSGEAYCWGNHSNFGQLGTGDSDLRDRPAPVPVSGGHRFVSLNVGIPSCGILLNGAAYCWGGGAVPELGIKSKVERLDRPVQVSTDLRFERVASGAFFACGIASGGLLYCWGYNRYGQTGNGSTEDVDVPQQISKKLRFALVTAGGNEFSGHACGITTDGRAMCWGDNRWGQLGNGSIAQATRPTLVASDIGRGDILPGSRR